MMLTASPWGSTNFWMSHQRTPLCTRIRFAVGENQTTLFSRRMSRCRLPGLAVWPPMLKWPPPTDSGYVVLRTTSTTCSTLTGVTIARTGTGFSRVTSLTMVWRVSLMAIVHPQKHRHEGAKAHEGTKGIDVFSCGLGLPSCLRVFVSKLFAISRSGSRRGSPADPARSGSRPACRAGTRAPRAPTTVRRSERAARRATAGAGRGRAVA